MQQVPEHIDVLIANVLTGEADAAQLAELSAWKSVSPANEQYFREQEKLFSLFSDKFNPDVQSAWQKLEARMQEEPKVIPLFRSNTFRAAAAIILILVIIVLFRSFWTSEADVRVYESALAKLETRLPDGSDVVLNKASEIKYARKKGRRVVQLKGEAYFKVVHNEKEPFVVEAGGLVIEDIGTAFNVRALPGGELVEVYVEEGIVKIYRQGEEGLELKAGESGLFDKRGMKLEKSARPAAAPAGYATGRFSFNNARLEDVAAQLSAYYAVEITMSDNIRDCRLSVNFNNESIDEVILVIEETLNLNAEVSQNKIALSGEGCR